MSKNPQKNAFLGWYNRFLSQFSTNSSSLNPSNSSWIESSVQKSEFLSKELDSRKENTRFGNNRLSQASETSKQQVVSITYEEIGLFPRSFNRVFDRFFKQLFSDVENLVVQEYRFYRYLFLTTVKCVFILISVPLFVNFCSKTYLIRPITEYYWNAQQPEIFLNSYMQKRAFNQLKDFEETIYFESLILPEKLSVKEEAVTEEKVHASKSLKVKPAVFLEQNSQAKILYVSSSAESASESDFDGHMPKMEIQRFQNELNTYIQKGLQHKTLEIANHYNEESVEAITNFFADLMSFGTLWFLISSLEIQINITKSFLLEVFFGLDDSKKSLLILFVTDLLVGYHSPNIWELFFSSFFDHYGLPENETTIFLLVATLPVLLDVLFKYLIFRHLNRASPATVATYHAMIE